MSDLPIKPKSRQAAEDSLVATTSLVPVLGALATPFLITELSRRHSEKRDNWLKDLEARLVKLESEQKIDLSQLLENEKFLELAYFVIQQGQSTMNQEKHDLLSDVLLNYSERPSMDDEKKYIFMKYIEQFTPSHIHFLEFLAEPVSYFSRNQLVWPDLMMGGRTTIINLAFPSWNSDFINLLASDLLNAGLIQSSSMNVTMSGAGLTQSLATSLGHEFLAFVQRPDLGE